MRLTRRLIGLVLALGLAVPAATAADSKENKSKKNKSKGTELRDLYFGEALYHARQGQFFEAIQRLDTELYQYHRLDEPQLDTLHFHINDAEFSVGDFELDYRMHNRAGRAIKAVLDGAVEDEVRNEAAYRLARIHFQKGQLDDALHALERIHGTVPVQIQDDIEFLRANIYMATGRAVDAVKVLERLQSDKNLAGFVAYNLGIAKLQAGQQQQGIEQLDKAGLMLAQDRAGQAIRDKSNLVLGSLLFQTSNFDRAKASLDRVRLTGPFSNQALLQAGAAEVSANKFDRALVPWNILATREPTDVAVQEAAIAVPDAYANLKLYGRAAIMYGHALELYSNQIKKVDASLASVREGKFLEALSREESREDETWVIRLRSLPDAPETYYLMELMASHDFQTALHNYLDLEDLRLKLLGWQTGVEAFADMVKLRNENYEPLLPGVDARFGELDLRMRLRLEQRKHLAKRLEAMLTAPRPEFLATADERQAAERIAQLEKQLGDSDDPQTVALRKRAERLRGTLTFKLETEYQERLTTAYKHLSELNAQVEELNRQHESFIRTRQAAVHSYAGYDDQIAGLRDHISLALENVKTLMARQGHLIETVAINQLEARRNRLVAQQTAARYGVADSYDRAALAQTKAEEQ